MSLMFLRVNWLQKLLADGSVKQVQPSRGSVQTTKHSSAMSIFCAHKKLILLSAECAYRLCLLYLCILLGSSLSKMCIYCAIHSPSTRAPP